MSSLHALSGERTGTNRSIQGMRGLAAVSVVIYHLHAMGTKAGFWPEVTTGFMPQVGLFSVCMFFCISGYLIAGTLVRHGDVRRFAINRIARIYPVFLLLHLVMFTLGPLIGYEWMGSLRSHSLDYAGHFFSNLLFLPGVLALPIAQKNAWSLSYEALFYILASCVFLGQRKGGGMGSRVLGIFGWAACFGMVWAEPLVLFFAIGVLLWWLQGRGWLASGSTHSWLGLVGLVAAFLLFAHRGENTLWAVASVPWGILFFAEVVRDRGGCLAALRTQVMNFFGKISYSLYLTHPFVLDPLRRACGKLQDAQQPLLAHLIFLLAGFGFAVLAGWVSYELIEVRFTRWVQGSLRMKSKETSASVHAPEVDRIDTATV